MLKRLLLICVFALSAMANESETNHAKITKRVIELFKENKAELKALEERDWRFKSGYGYGDYEKRLANKALKDYLAIKSKYDNPSNEAYKEYSKLCESFSNSCIDAGENAFALGEVKEAKKYFNKACDGGLGIGCALAMQIEEDSKSAYLLNKKALRLGASVIDYDIFALLDSTNAKYEGLLDTYFTGVFNKNNRLPFLKNIENIKEYVKGLGLDKRSVESSLKEACDSGNIEVCKGLFMAEIPKGKKGDIAKLEYLCNAFGDRTCNDLEGVVPNLDKAVSIAEDIMHNFREPSSDELKLLKQMCELNNIRFCDFLGELKEAELKKQDSANLDTLNKIFSNAVFKEMLKYYDKACEIGSASACYSISDIYSYLSFSFLGYGGGNLEDIAQGFWQGAYYGIKAIFAPFDSDVNYLINLLGYYKPMKADREVRHEMNKYLLILCDKGNDEGCRALAEVLGE